MSIDIHGHVGFTGGKSKSSTKPLHVDFTAPVVVQTCGCSWDGLISVENLLATRNFRETLGWMIML
jgi:hypothetical protein